MRFVEADVCKETKSVLCYDPLNIRFPSLANVFEAAEEPPINYGEYVTALVQYRELANSELFSVRMAWALLRLMN